MNIELKTKFYNILTSDLQYRVFDTPVNSKAKFPWVRLTLGNISRDTFQGNFVYNYTFTVDIFSDYNGEKEILEMEEEMFEALQRLYEVTGVTYVRETSFKILDDNSLGPIRKHGVIKYNILCNGDIKEV